MMRWLLLRKESGRRGRGFRGVTAVELIIIVTMLALLSVIAIPTVSPIVLRYRLRGSAWQLAGDLRLARQRAVTLKKRFRVCVTGCTMTVPTGAYSIERDDGSPSSPIWVSDTGVVTKLALNVTVGTTATPVFTYNGMASGATFTLTNVLGQYQVTVNSTGRVQVCEGTCSSQ